MHFDSFIESDIKKKKKKLTFPSKQTVEGKMIF